MRDTTLMIMAAGIGSRFGGGIKQLEPVGPNGENIMDYSIHDALEAGFNKIVFIIRHDLEADFKEVIGDRISRIAHVEYAFQELDDLPAGYTRPEGRTKPWGTGQAVLSARGLIREPFLVINADDYYGKTGFAVLHDYMAEQMDMSGGVYDICMGGFMLSNTLSENGGVTRGVCVMDGEGHLTGVNETYEVRAHDGLIDGVGDDGQRVLLDAGRHVSMNMWGLPPSFMDELERGFPPFLDSLKPDDYKTEYLLPRIIDHLIKEGRARVKVLETPDRWFGVTYQEDKPAVAAAVRGLIADGVYGERLFDI